MTQTRLYLLAAGLALAGALLIALGLGQAATIVVDGVSLPGAHRALTAGGALRAAGVAVTPGDRITPPAGRLLLTATQIRVVRAAQVALWNGTQHVELLSAERLPANLLAQAGWKLFPGDVVALDGRAIDPTRPLSAAASYTLQVRPAAAITLLEPGHKTTLYSAAATLGAALWEAGLRLDPADRLDPPAETPLNGPRQAILLRARELTIHAGGEALRVRSAAATVGEALADAGLSLQGLDYSQPGEGEPIPADGAIRVVRVREDVVLEQKSIPFKNTYQFTDAVELDQKQVVEPGQPGVEVSRMRVRYEDGAEVSRQAEGSWVAREPKDQVVGYGTKVVVRTAVVDGVTIEYWRTVQVYATSYSACDVGNCNARTASGLPAQRGVIAVIRAWYNQMAGQQVYVPGYGSAVIADIGGGVPGRHWIDLAYGKDDYVAWHQTVTIYFLTPVPANIPWVLP